MKIRTRLSIAFLILGGAGVYWLVNWVLDDLRPRYLATMEETMVDFATVLAAAVESRMEGGEIQVDGLRGVLASADRKALNATIYEYTKTRLNVRVYVTDAKGWVVFDSEGGQAEGQDYSSWNDVTLTLRGQYGARATHRIPDDPMSAVLYVASPLLYQGEIVGVLSVGKPANSVRIFLQTAQREIVLAGIVVAVAVILMGFAVSRWVSWPIEQLTRYAEAVRDGKRAPLPALKNDEIGKLGTTFEEMRVALAGKQYIEDYVQTLTHQLKSPVSAIRGALELLSEDMPEAERKRFCENLRAETARMQTLIDRMLDLASLENRETLRDTEDLDLAALVRDVMDRSCGVGDTVQVKQTGADTLPFNGERFLLEQAIGNLLQNAREFAEAGSTITIQLNADGGDVTVDVINKGPTIPEYALDQIFERFYSLPRPDTGRKSTGLGLPFVRNVANLHGGEVYLENRPDGVLARLRLPVRS